MSTASPNESTSALTRRRQLMFLFAAAALLQVLSAAITFRVGRMSLDAQRHMAVQLSALNQLRDWGSTIKDLETGQRGYLLTGQENYLQPFHDGVAHWKEQYTNLQKMVVSGDVSGEELDRIADLIHQKQAELEETIELRRTKGFDTAMAVVESNLGKSIMDQIRVNLERMIKTAQQRFDEAQVSADRANTLRLVIFAAMTALNLMFLAWAYRRISREEWLQSGQSQLSRQTSGDPSLTVLGEKVLKFLAEYTKAQAGAIFVEDGGVYRQFATYALPAAEKLVQKFAVGEGLLGQAAKDLRTFTIHDVPEGYLSIGSGLGTSRPRQLIIAPMKIDGSANAVIELGYFHAPDPAVLDLLERVSESVGIAIRSAKYRTRLQELLEETQRQAEELQAQSEELRVSNEELEEQSRALKESQARLEQQQAELEQSNSQLEEQTQILETQRDDLTRTKGELEAQAVIVEQASRYKSDFLANMSHELRTPLNSSLILAKLLADNREGNLTAEQVKYATTIQSAGNDLLTLINDVLDLSKVEAGHMDLKAEVFPVSDLLDGLRGMFEPLATSKGLSLRFNLATDAPKTLETDRRRLEQVLKNLLANALKFTERGEAALEVTRSAGRCLAFAVRDTGIGIAPDQQKIVFEPFCQADSAANRKYGGTGLGLSISRELVRLMGGNIELSSELGQGSVFTVILPETFQTGASRPPTIISPRPAAPATVKKVASIPDDREKLSGHGRVLLVVEDDESFARILADLSHELNFQVVIATSAEEALALAKQFQPSAILLDIGLPDNSGMFVLERLKADARTRHIPVHIVSGSDHAETALSMGAVGYMLKPVKREELIEAFRKLEARLTQKLRRVLLVEDDKVQLDSLRHLLGSGDVETVGVSTAGDCLEKLKSATFDCMVLDLTLPDASGFSLLETLNAEESYSFPPVIIYTGRELSAEEEQRLRKYSKSIIIKGAKSPERLLDEVTLFLHQVVSDLPAEQQRMLEKARSRDASLEDRRILITEDDVRNIFALTSLLEPRGVKVQIARNGREALQALEASGKDPAKRIDLVLMDIMMPEMNGIEAMRAIRKNPAWQKLPIIALTAKAMEDDQRQCIQAGASDYLPKPLDVEKLLSLIRVWMPR